MGEARFSSEGAQIVHYNDLPPSARQRFLGCLEASPLLREPEGSFGDLGWALALAAALIVLGVAVGCGWGMSSRVALRSGLGAAILHGTFASVVVFAALSIASRRARARALPYPPGRYLLPGGFIDARAAQIVFIPLTDLADVKSTTKPLETAPELLFHSVELIFLGGRVEKFSVLGRKDQIGLEAVRDLPSQQARLKAAVAAGDSDVLRTFDPFAEIRPEDDMGSDAEAPLARGVPQILRLRGALAVLVGVGTLGVLMQKILPAAALQEAQRENTVGAYRALRRDHPVRWIEEETKAAIAARYEAAKAAFAARASSGDPRVLPFVERLLGWLEAHDTSAIRVRYVGSGEASLKDADEQVKTWVANVAGKSAAEVNWLFQHGLDPTEEYDLADHVQKGLFGPIPTDVVSLSSGRWMTDTERAEAEQAGGPVLEIRYAVGWSGMGYEGEGRRMYPGISLTVDLSLALPEGGEPLRLHVVATLPKSFPMSRLSLGEERGVKDPALDKLITQMDDKRVYRQMVVALLEDLSRKVGGR